MRAGFRSPEWKKKKKDGGHDGSYLPTHHMSSVHIRPDVPPSNSVLIIPLRDCEVRLLFFSDLWGSLSRLLHHPERLTNWLNLAVSERSY